MPHAIKTLLVTAAIVAATSGSASAQLAGQTIRIAVGGPLTTGSATFGVEMRQAVDLSVDEKNAAGGILGAKLEAVAVDDQANADKGVSVAKGFCDDATVLGVVGHVNSGVTVAASTAYKACGLPMITPMSSNPAVTDRGLDNVFRLTARDDDKGPALARYVYTNLSKRKAAVIDDQTPYGKGVADAFAKGFTAVGGEVVAHPSIPVGATDFRAALDGLPRDFDLLFFGGISEAAPLLRQMRAQGLNQLFACGDGCWDVKGFIEPSEGAWSKGEGVLILSAAPAIGEVPGSADFATRYTHRYGLIANYAANSYDSARILIAAIESAAAASKGVPTRAEVLDALRATKYQGIAYAQPVEWNAKGDNQAAAIFLNVVSDGRFRQVAAVGKAG